MAAAIVSACSSPPVFDKNRAFDDLEQICSFGPRVANTEAHTKAGQFLYNSLRSTTDICRIQSFTIYDSTAGVSRRMFNIIASYYPEEKNRILLCAHWDSRPFSDQESDSSMMTLAIPGANDGASGTAILLEIGRILKVHKPPVGIDIALFDGEDYGTDNWRGGWFLGSRYFIQTLKGYRPRAAILLDMVGDSDLMIYREAISQQYAGDLNDYIWKIAAGIGAESFIDSVNHTVSDDHISLLSQGIKAVDIIDFDYPYWHTQADTPDKCSSESLGEVGNVIIEAVFNSGIRDF